MTDRSVTVGFSGGVDSTATILLMKERYRKTVAATMWLYDGQESDFDRLERLADALGVPFHVLDFRQAFEREVVQPYVRLYESGLTPNPCIFCNHALKYGRFLEAVQTDYLALGHYARKVVRDGEYILYRSLAAGKDQSYNLYRLGQRQLGRILFPLGAFESKDAVRSFVREKLRQDASGAGRDSMGACFLKGEAHLKYLRSIGSCAAEPGDFVDSEGRVIGRHEGIAGYTVGQKPRVRKKERVDGMTSPYLVLGTVTGFDVHLNRVRIGNESEVYARSIRIEGVSFLSERRRRSIPVDEVSQDCRKPLPVGSDCPETALPASNHPITDPEMPRDDADKSGFRVEIRLSQWSEVYRGRLKFCGGIADGCMPETDEKKDGAETPCGGDSIAVFESETPMRAPAPGQAAVFYLGDELLGGGIITGAQRP